VGSLNDVVDNIQWAGRKVHDVFSPPYSWMMQLGMDFYGLNHPWAFNYWNVPNQLAKASSYVMEPSAEEKDKMEKEGTPYGHTPSRAVMNAAAAYASGGDPMQSFVSTLQENSPLRTAAALATGSEPVDPSSILSAVTGMNPDMVSKMLINSASGPFKSLFQQATKVTGARDPLAMVLGVALPQSSASVTAKATDLSSTKPASSIQSPQTVASQPKDGPLPATFAPLATAPMVNLDMLKNAFSSLPPSPDEPVSHVASALLSDPTVEPSWLQSSLSSLPTADPLGNLMAGMSKMAVHADPVNVLASALMGLPTPVTAVRQLAPEVPTTNPGLETLKTALDAVSPSK
jgi:hypothetical protein